MCETSVDGIFFPSSSFVAFGGELFGRNEQISKECHRGERGGEEMHKNASTKKEREPLEQTLMKRSECSSLPYRK